MRNLGATTVLIGPATDITPITWDIVTANLNGLVGSPIAQGDSWQYGASPNYISAVESYQTAGQAGADEVGPEIDAAGNPSLTQKYTQQAWTLNAALANVNSKTSTQSDAQLAEQYAKQMYATYQLAAALGKSGIKSSSQVWRSGLVLGIVGLLGVGLYESMKYEGTFPFHRGRHARHR